MSNTMVPVSALPYAASLSFYYLRLHPMAQFPGPGFAAITGWCETYLDLFSIPRGKFATEIGRT